LCDLLLIKDCCSTSSRDRLSDLLAEHLDHIHYVNDILCLRIDSLNEVLTAQLLQRLFIPLYLGSLVPEIQASSCAFHSLNSIHGFQRNTLHVGKVVALFLLTNVFLIITHKPLIEQLLSMLLFGDENDIQVQSLPSDITKDSLVASLELASEAEAIGSRSNSCGSTVPEPTPASLTTAVDAAAELDDDCGLTNGNAVVVASPSFSSNSTDRSKNDRPVNIFSYFPTATRTLSGLCLPAT
jgi:hypothetical protein